MKTLENKRISRKKGKKDIMKKRKFLSYLLALAMIATLMTACGKTEETPEPTTETVETTEVAETETVAEKTTELSSPDNNINITGELGLAADMTVEPVEETTESEIKDLVSSNLEKDISATESYDIALIDENENTVQPDGTVTITIPISDEMTAAEGDTYAVYYYNPENTTVENIDCDVINDSIVFETTHFSVYSIVKYTSEPVEEKTTEEISESETEPVETVETKESVSTENTNPEPAPAATAELPGRNRNGRYADIPESVLPSSEAAYCDFFDNPVQVTTWEDVTGTIYADFARTQVIKEATSDDIIYVIAAGDKDCMGTAIAIYNNQYVVINEALFEYIW